MTSPFAALLPPLCLEYQIDTEYWDIWGRHHRTEEPTILAILDSFGLDTSSPENLAASLAARKRQRPLDPVAVLSV